MTYNIALHDGKRGFHHPNSVFSPLACLPLEFRAGHPFGYVLQQRDGVDEERARNGCFDEAEESWTGLPAEFTVKDLESVRFRPALRGYRMEDVDAAMAMLRARLSELETAAPPAEAASPTRPTTSPDGPETAAGPR